MPDHKLCVPCLFGLEGPLGNELRHMGLRGVMPENGRVRCTGTDADIARMNIRCRFGERVLLELGSFPAPTFDALFEGVKALPWADYLPADAAFPVKGYSLESALHSVPDCQKIIKKAVVESLKRRYALNICSVGIDARIGTEVHQYHDSYVLSAVANLFKGIAQPLTVRGCGMEYSGGTSLICACNGRFYGGGFNPIPDSMPDNGKLEFLVVRDVSRLQFIQLVGKYAKGRYRELEKYITHLEGDHLEIDSENEIVVNIDGEALYSKHVNFDLIPGGVNFLVPANMAFFHPETAGGHETREFVHS